MRQNDTKPTISNPSKLADYIAETLFEKHASSQIPGLVQGTERNECGRCHHFQISRSALSALDLGEDVIGICNAWGAHSSAHKRCPRFTEGEAHAY